MEPTGNPETATPGPIDVKEDDNPDGGGVNLAGWVGGIGAAAAALAAAVLIGRRRTLKKEKSL